MVFQVDAVVIGLIISVSGVALSWVVFRFNVKKIQAEMMQRDRDKTERDLKDKTIMEEAMKRYEKDLEGIGQKVRQITNDHGGRITEMEKNYAVQNTKLDQIIDLLKSNSSALTRHIEEYHGPLSNQP